MRCFQSLETHFHFIWKRFQFIWKHFQFIWKRFQFIWKCFQFNWKCIQFNWKQMLMRLCCAASTVMMNIHAISVCWQRQSFWNAAPWNFFWKNSKTNEFFWDKKSLDSCDDSAIHAISVCWRPHSCCQRRLTAPSASADSAIHAISIWWQRY